MTREEAEALQPGTVVWVIYHTRYGLGLSLGCGVFAGYEGYCIVEDVMCEKKYMHHDFAFLNPKSALDAFMEKGFEVAAKHFESYKESVISHFEIASRFSKEMESQK